VPGLAHDFGASEEVDLVAGAGDGDGLAGEEPQAVGVGGGAVQVLLHGGVQVTAREDEGRGGRAHADVAGHFAHDEGLGEALGGLARLARSGLRVARGARPGRRLGLRSGRVEGVDEFDLAGVGVEGARLLRTGGVGQGAGAARS